MILAIDPGNTQSGFVQIDGTRIVTHGVIPNEEMIGCISSFLGAIDISYPRVAIEEIRNMGMIVGQEVFDTVFWTGRFYEVIHGYYDHRRSPTEPICAELIPRNAIKMHLCGSPRAKDANIRQSLINRWGAPGTKKAPGGTYGVKSHAWAALAVATYALDNP